MLFSLLRKYGTQILFDQDPGAGGAPSEDTEDGTGDDPQKDEAERPEEKRFTQAELDAIIADRLQREKKQQEKVAEKARKEAEDKALAERQEWKTLAEQRAQEVTDLTRERDELLPVKEEADKYKAAVQSMVAESLKSLPKHVAPLVQRMDPLEALEYLSKNAKEFNLRSPAGFPETPENKELQLSKDDLESGKRAQQQAITSTF